MAYFQNDVEVLIDSAALRQRVQELGASISRAYAGKPLVLLGILKGSVFFLTDLARAIDLPLTLEFLGVSSYQDRTVSSGEVRITSDSTRPLAGKHVLVVEDIIDTGSTMKFLLENLRARQPASLAVCTLLHKPSRAKVAVPLDYVGFTVADVFVVGYGLDYSDRFRNLPFIGVLKEHPPTS